MNLVDPTGEFGVISAVAIGFAILTTTDFVVTTYYDYQIFQMLEKQKQFYKEQIRTTDPCLEPERHLILEKAHEHVVLQQGAIAAKAGMNLVVNFISYLRPTSP